MRVRVSVLLIAILLGAIAYVAISSRDREARPDAPPSSPGPTVPPPELLKVPTPQVLDEERSIQEGAGRVFRGTVLHAKTLQPLAAATVTLLGTDPRRSSLAEVVTGSDGSYALAVQHPEEVEVIEVRKMGFFPGHVSLDDEPGQVRDFELESARAVKGRVHLGDGKPVPAGRVFVLETSEFGSLEVHFPIAEDGTFVAAARGNKAAVLAVGDDFQPTVSGRVDLRG